MLTRATQISFPERTSVSFHIIIGQPIYCMYSALDQNQTPKGYTEI
jgi:hypothetical protein